MRALRTRRRCGIELRQWRRRRRAILDRQRRMWQCELKRELCQDDNKIETTTTRTNDDGRIERYRCGRCAEAHSAWRNVHARVALPGMAGWIVDSNVLCCEVSKCLLTWRAVEAGAAGDGTTATERTKSTKRHGQCGSLLLRLLFGFEYRSVFRERVPRDARARLLSASSSRRSARVLLSRCLRFEFRENDAIKQQKANDALELSSWTTRLTTLASVD